MAKVFEALLQSREHSPDQTKKFLDDFDFGNTKSENTIGAVELPTADMPIPSGERFDDEEIPTSFFDSVAGTVTYAETAFADAIEPAVTADEVNSALPTAFADPVQPEVSLPVEMAATSDFTATAQFDLPQEDPASHEWSAPSSQALAPVYPLFPGVQDEVAPPSALETEHFASDQLEEAKSLEPEMANDAVGELPLFAVSATAPPPSESGEPASVSENFNFESPAYAIPETPVNAEPEVATQEWSTAGDLAALNADENELPMPVQPALPPPVVEAPPVAVHRVPGEFLKLSEIIHKAAETSPLKVLLVSSAEQNESADFVTKNLCLALSENSREKIGFLDLALPARRNRKIDEAVDFRIRIHNTPISNLREIIPDGGPVSVSGLFAECDVVQLFQTLRSRFDFLVIKAPSVAAVPEVKSLASMVDGVILSADKDSAHSGALDEVKARLKASNARILGTLLNRHRDPRSNIAA